MQPEQRNAVALRAAMTVLEQWKASPGQIQDILQIPEGNLDLSQEQLQRISIVLNIHEILRTVFENPLNVYGFPAMKNDNPFFCGKSPLEVMAQGDMTSLQATLKHVDSLMKNGGW
ncbi:MULTISPECIES: hypothetical protein [Pseudomonas putida group]|uniref:hypothetical protein n=1 Tax=Pseudomonas putida group TaxID=136845 RepID=UPI00051DDFA2|nr:hypothetical protein [Pseudomonas plecoglossicida]KGK25766.1 hypothetical protein GT93_13385 [Pseudomonas plecoglossicida]